MCGRSLRARRAGLARARSLPARPLSAAMLAGVWVSNAAQALVAPASPASPAAAALHSRWPGTEVSRDSRGLVWWWLGSRGGAGLRADLLFQCVDAPKSTGFPLAGRGVHRAASRTPPGWTAQPGPAPPEPARSRERGDVCLPALAPVLASHLSDRAFSLEQPRPSPERARPSNRVRAGRPSLRGPGEGDTLPHVFLAPGTGFPSPAPTPQHSGDGGGEARLQLPFVPRGMAETWRPCWASPGGRAARGVGLFRETLALPWAGFVGARAERVGRGRPFLEESGPTGFCLQPEVGPVVLQGEQIV